MTRSAAILCLAVCLWCHEGGNVSVTSWRCQCVSDNMKVAVCLWNDDGGSVSDVMKVTAHLSCHEGGSVSVTSQRCLWHHEGVCDVMKVAVCQNVCLKHHLHHEPTFLQFSKSLNQYGYSASMAMFQWAEIQAKMYSNWINIAKIIRVWSLQMKRFSTFSWLGVPFRQCYSFQLRIFKCIQALHLKTKPTSNNNTLTLV